MTLFMRLIPALSRALGVVSALMILAAVMVVCQMVFVRYVLNASTVWQTETVTYLLIAAIFLGSPYVLMVKGHVYVDLVPLYVGPRTRFGLALAAYGISFLFAVLIAWRGWALWWEAWSLGWSSDTVWAPPLWIPYLAMPVGFSLLSLQYVVETVAMITGREPPFGIAPEHLPTASDQGRRGDGIARR
jgi:TRAP-type C4-dicarboxylate transport system permease small subunit